MSDEPIKKIIEDSYDDSKEETLRSMASDLYSRRLLSTAILVWVWAIIFIALAVFSAVQFFKTDQTQWQIMYAALFILGAHGVGLMKIFAWEMVHRHSIKREIKRLELRVAELSETIKGK
jgi:positive regulator of sigma E activity